MHRRASAWGESGLHSHPTPGPLVAGLAFVRLGRRPEPPDPSSPTPTPTPTHSASRFAAPPPREYTQPHPYSPAVLFPFPIFNHRKHQTPPNNQPPVVVTTTCHWHWRKRLQSDSIRRKDGLCTGLLRTRVEKTGTKRNRRRRRLVGTNAWYAFVSTRVSPKEEKAATQPT